MFGEEMIDCAPCQPKLGRFGRQVLHQSCGWIPATCQILQSSGRSAAEDRAVAVEGKQSFSSRIDAAVIEPRGSGTPAVYPCGLVSRPCRF